MKINTIEFICSSPDLRLCPRAEIPEFAFIGRSNVGKSSLINMLAGRKGVAKVSGTPGKTRLINHYMVNGTIKSQTGKSHDKIDPDSWFLVDLPGYGFAKLSKTQREKFEGMIKNYLAKRENLVCTFLLVDARLEPQKNDLEFMNWMGDQEIPFVLLFTKTDKFSGAKLPAALAAYKKEIALHWEELPEIVPTSSETGAGREEILALIQKMLLEIGYTGKKG
jgi:GTP-binding protein